MKERFKTVINNVHDGLIAINKENKISVSKEIAKILSSLKRFPKMYPRIASDDNIPISL